MTIGPRQIPYQSPEVAVRQRASQLTRRQRQVLKLLRDGKTNAEIAHELHLGVETIKSHASAIFAAVGVRSRTELFEAPL
jgi:DNA-binding NarL/FixJ family response regulator